MDWRSFIQSLRDLTKRSFEAAAFNRREFELFKKSVEHMVEVVQKSNHFVKERSLAIRNNFLKMRFYLA
jgi:hypothetical protein